MNRLTRVFILGLLMVTVGAIWSWHTFNTKEHEGFWYWVELFMGFVVFIRGTQFIDESIES